MLAARRLQNAIPIHVAGAIKPDRLAGGDPAHERGRSIGARRRRLTLPLSEEDSC